MLLGILAVAGNISVWRLIVRLQNRDVGSGLIPPRGSWEELGSGRIPHLQDYWTNGVWGDVVGLSLIDWAVFSTISHGRASWWMLLVLPFGVAAAGWFFKLATREERARKGMDWWFVPYFHNLTYTGSVRVTTAGRLHLAYFAAQSGVALLGLVLLPLGEPGTLEAMVGVAGGFLYAVAFALDKAQGHL